MFSQSFVDYGFQIKAQTAITKRKNKLALNNWLKTQVSQLDVIQILRNLEVKSAVHL